MPDTIDADEIKPIPFAWLHPAFGGDPRLQVGPTERAPVPTKAAPSALKRVENALLSGERLSGTALYRIRTELGFSRIEELEQEAKEKEWGKWWTISPSQALGIAEFGEDKFELLDRSTWSLGGAARGTVAFAADVILDPFTWVTIGAGGLAKIGGKSLIKVAGKTLVRKGGIRVGLRGTEEIATRVATGATREAAGREMLERMARDPTFHAKMMTGGEQMIRFGTRARHIDLMRTGVITEPLGAAWRAAPMYGTRSRGWDVANRWFGSRYYDLTQAMEKTKRYGSERAFQLFHRRKDTDIALLERQFRDVVAKIPDRGRVDVVRQAMEDSKIKLAAPEMVVRTELKKISDELFDVQLGEGLVKKEQRIEWYLRHQSTKELQKFFRAKRATEGRTYAEKDIPEYTRKLWSAMKRETDATIDVLNAYFLKEHGIKKAYETDLNEILAGYARQHVQAVEFAKLEKGLAREYGHPARRVATVRTDIDDIIRDATTKIEEERIAKSMKVIGLEQTLEEAHGYAAPRMKKFDVASAKRFEKALAPIQERAQKRWIALEDVHEALVAKQESYYSYADEMRDAFERESKVLQSEEVSRLRAAKLEKLTKLEKKYAGLRGVKPITSADVKRWEAKELEKFGRFERLAQRPVTTPIEKASLARAKKAYFAAQTDLGVARVAYKRGGAIPTDLLSQKDTRIFRETKVKIATARRSAESEWVDLTDWSRLSRIKEQSLEEQLMRGREALQTDVRRIESEAYEAKMVYEDVKKVVWGEPMPSELGMIGRPLRILETEIAEKRATKLGKVTSRQEQLVATTERNLEAAKTKYMRAEMTAFDVTEPTARAKAYTTKELKLEPTRVFDKEELYLYKMASGKQVYFPEPIAKELRKPMRRYLSQPDTQARELEELYIGVETTLKKSLTVLWPAFFARNIQGGMFQNYLEGVEAMDYYRSWDILMRTSDYKLARGFRKVFSIDDAKKFDVPLMGEKTAKELRDVMEYQGVVGTATGRMDVPLSAVRGGTPTGALGKGWNWLWNKYPETAMTGTEAMVRSPLFMHELYKGQTAEAAELIVGKTHFRYGTHELTEAESTIMKRIMPFWTWARWNIRRQSEMVIRRPGKYATLFKAQERVVSEEERARMPDWMREKLGFTVDDTFVGVDLPIGEMPGLYGMGDIGFGISPMIKWPIGQVMGRDVLTGRPVTGLERRAEFTYESLLPRGTYAMKEVRKTAVGERPLSWTMAHQFGGVGVYEMRERGGEEAYWSKIGRKPAWYPEGQEEYEAWKVQEGWSPRLTEQGQFALSTQLGDTDIFGTPCNGQCVRKHIVPVELGGSNVLSNMALVHRSNLHQFEEYMQPMAIERVRSPTTLPVVTAEDRYKFSVMHREEMDATMAQMS